MKSIFSNTFRTMLSITLGSVLLGNAYAGHSENAVNFLMISDSHLDITNLRPVNINPKEGVKGADLDVDSFHILVRKMAEAVNQIPEKPDFSMILGDLPSHNSKALRTLSLKVSLQAYYENLSPMPIFYSFGNNDSPVDNYGAFLNVVNNESPYTIGDSISGGNGGFLYTGKQCPNADGPCLINANTKYGYYSAYVADKLRMLSLNSVIFVEENKYFKVSRTGDEEQLAWMEEELKAAEANGEQVIFSMHVPPIGWRTDYNDKLLKILNQHPKVVTGMFVAHAHTNALMILRTNDSNIPIIYTVGLSTGAGNSAGFKTVSMKRDAKNKPWMIQNFSVYRFNGNEAKTAVAEKFYDFNTTYCPKSNEINFDDCLAQNISPHGHVTSRAMHLLQQHLFASPDYAAPFEPWFDGRTPTKNPLADLHKRNYRKKTMGDGFQISEVEE